MIDVSSKNVVHAIYACFAASFFIPPAIIVGIIFCYLKRDESDPAWIRTHFDWLIKTFWWTMAGMLVGLIATMIFLGWVIMMATAIWFLYRVIKGWLALSDGMSVGPVRC